MSKKAVDVSALKEKATLFRREILEMLSHAGSGHPGGSLSLVEILITLYDYKMNHKPKDPNWFDRDRLIVSKGHGAPVVYVTLAHQGYFPKSYFQTLRKLGSSLQGHVQTKTPGIEFNTGSLGHGLGIANGVALGAKLLKKDFKTYCILGDGELQEGSNWEAAMSAAQYKLDNLCAIVDYNKVQENGPVKDIMNLEPLRKKWETFGWHCIEVDGHDFQQLMQAFDEFDTVQGKPTVIVAHTIKGKGVSFMEGQSKWHGKAPDAEQLKAALAELTAGGRS